tara:strand:- start:783 stop:1265 length:483 start_codon:yes stop_codon:yes gene_type:complete
MVMVSGCGGDGSPVNIPPVSHCSDLTEYRKVVELSRTTYQISNNTCNSITDISFAPDGAMIEVRKIAYTHYGQDELIVIDYSPTGFSYRDWTIGRYQDTGTQAIDYEYTNGDNFITYTLMPGHFLKYYYEGDEDGKFNSILQGAHYEIVLAEFMDAIPDI